MENVKTEEEQVYIIFHPGGVFIRESYQVDVVRAKSKKEAMWHHRNNWYYVGPVPERAFAELSSIAKPDKYQ